MAQAKREQIELVVITPEQQVLAVQADSVSIPAHDGELGILHDRAPIMCELGIGQLRYSQGGQTKRLFIDAGFAQVFDNHVTVLTQDAMPVDQITSEQIENAEQFAKEQGGHDEVSRTARERAQQRARMLRSLQNVR